MDLLLRMLLACPKCCVRFGVLLSGACLSLVLLGLRVGRKMERLEQRSGALVDVDKFIAGLPLPIPTTAGQLILTGTGIFVGALIAYLGKWASRF
jgi:hypothetical protein